MKHRIRHASGLIFRPVAVAFDPRLEGLEHRLVLRMVEMENRVATDAEVTSEMATLQARSLGQIGERMAALEDRLARIEGLLDGLATRAR